MAKIDDIIDEHLSEEELMRRYYHWDYLKSGKRQLKYSKKKNRERCHKYYLEHRDEMIAKAKKYRENHSEFTPSDKYYIQKAKETIAKGNEYAPEIRRGRVTKKNMTAIYKELAIGRANLYTFSNREFNKKKKILCIIGRTGVGKTLASLHLKFKCGANVVCTFTDRKPREYEIEGREHHFITAIPAMKDEKIARTRCMGGQYFALKSQIYGDCTVFVINEKGFWDLLYNHSDEYILVPVLIKRNYFNIKASGVDMKLFKKDKPIEMPKFLFNTIIENDSTKRHLFEEIERVYKEVCEL